MKLLTCYENQLIIGGKKVCYCNQLGGTSLPSRKPTSSDGCKHYCCDIIHTGIVNWTYIRDGIRTDGECPIAIKPGPSFHGTTTPIAGPEYNYLY